MEYRMDPNRQPRFIIRSCFGGSNAAFVASGSEARPQCFTAPHFIMDRACSPASFAYLAVRRGIEALWDNASPVGVQCCPGGDVFKDFWAAHLEQEQRLCTIAQLGAIFAGLPGAHLAQGQRTPAGTAAGPLWDSDQY